MREIHFLKLAFQGSACVHSLLTFLIEYLQIRQSQVRRLAVDSCHFMHNTDCVFILPSAHQVFGRFVKLEEEESAGEHDHSEKPHGNQKPSPSEILRFCACCSRLLACMIPKQRPGDKGRQQLSKGPED